MADNVRSAEVATLEAEVEDARQRLASTIDRLTDPATHEAVKNEIMGHVQSYKDQLLNYARDYKEELVSSARDAGREKMHGIVGGLKQRAIDNPAAAALIGAGIAWRLYKHPPVTTMLVGAGLAMLARSGGSRTADASAYRDPYDDERPRGYVPGGVAGQGYDSGFSNRIGATALEWQERAREAGSRAREAAYETGSRISQVAERVSSRADDLRQRAAAEFGEVARGSRESASSLFDQVRTNPLVLGALGLAGGLGLVAAARATETGERLVGSATEAVGRGAREAGSRVSEAARRAAEGAGALGTAVASAAGQATDAVARRAPDLSSRAQGRATRAREEGTRGRQEGSAGIASVSEVASRTYRTATEQAAKAGERATDVGRQMQNQFSELVEEYPFLVGAIGLALGAAAGVALRPTASEDEVLGPFSDTLKRRGREVASRQYEQAIAAAEDLADGLKASPRKGGRSDRSADWETVLGGGAPAAGATGARR